MNDCLVFVTAGTAFPPDIISGFLIHFSRCKRIIPFRPFPCKLRMCCREIIEAGKDLNTAAVRAPTSVRTGRDERLPLMSLAAAPPDFLISVRGDHAWFEWEISVGPFCRNLREKCLKVIKARQDDVVRAVRTSCPLDPALDCCSPFMAAGALPEHLLMRTGGDFIRAQLVLLRPF